MKTTLFLALLAFAGCGGDEATSQSSAPASTPLDCITCSNGFSVCDLCGLCALEVTRGTPVASVAGCLPGGSWCAQDSQSTCVVKQCATCP